jgi:hypothetical protein
MNLEVRAWRGAWHGTEEGFGVVTLTGDEVGWEAKRPDGV